MNGLIAVDGGGTKTEFILTDETGKVLFVKKYIGTNLNSFGFDKAFATLEEGLMDFANIAMKNNITISGAYFGLAGGVNGNNQQIVYDYFKNKYFRDIPFSNAGDDLNSINVGVKNAPNGIAVIAGTGSNVMLKRNGEVLPNPQLSGWGYLFDNGGSGFDYGREAVLAAKNEYNGLGEPTQITKMLEEKLGASVFDSLLQVYSKGPDFVASFAPIVFDAYRNGDKVAGQIIERQIQNVAIMINKGHDIIGRDLDAKVGLVGGIFSHEQEIIFPRLQQLIDKNLTLVLPQESQIYGALMEAAKNANIKTDAKFLKNYQETIDNPLLQSNPTGYEKQ